MIEHHLEAIDDALGLPAEYRLCSSGGNTARAGCRQGLGSRGGLLSGREWERLLEVVMTSGMKPGGLDNASLRENIRKIERYL